MKRLKLMIVVIIGLGLPFAAAQEFRGSILGRITDPSGAVVPGATIRVVNEETGTRIEAPSNENGNYTVPFLLPGRYSLTVELPGFKKAVRGGVVVQVQDKVTIDFTLEIGSTADSVVVTSETPLLQSANADLGHVVSRQFLDRLPITGQSPLSPVGLAVLGQYPLPNLTVPARIGLDNWAGASTLTLDTKNLQLRMDQQISQRQRIYARYSALRHYQQPTPNFFPGVSNFPVGGNTDVNPDFRRNNSFTADDTITFSRTLVGSVRYGFTRTSIMVPDADAGLDPTAFASLPNDFTISPEPARYGWLRGPSTLAHNLTIFKTFSLLERAKLEIRSEMNNIFNSPQFSNPATNRASKATFGMITSAGGSRTIQVGAKLRF